MMGCFFGVDESVRPSPSYPFLHRPTQVNISDHPSLPFSLFLTSLNGDFKNGVCFSGSVSWLDQINVLHLPLVSSPKALPLTACQPERGIYVPPLPLIKVSDCDSCINPWSMCVSLQSLFLFLLSFYHFINFFKSSFIDFFFFFCCYWHIILWQVLIWNCLKRRV